MKELTAVELTKENFKDYGYVISSNNGNPMGDNDEFLYWGKVSELNMSCAASTGILIARKRENFIRKLERHVSTPEILVALKGDSIICLAKPALDGDDKIEGIKAFYIKQGDAFAMLSGTWHWIPIPVNSDKSKFLVLFASGTEDNDLEIMDLEEEVKITL